MKHTTAFFPILATAAILTGVLISLAELPNEKDLCRNSSSESDSCAFDPCYAAPLPIAAPTNQPTPTLAPPQPEIFLQNTPSFQDLAKGKPVFLKIETDQNEIEVGWANP
jgi:hypothetical protein